MEKKLFTKSSPKVQDYNPITHSSFYNQKPQLQSPQIKQTPAYPLDKSRDSYSPVLPKSHSKNIFSQSGSYITRTTSVDLINHGVYFSKTRLRNQMVDPISGEVKVYNIQRPKVESFDVSSFRDKLSSNFDIRAVKDFQMRKNMLKPQGSVSGSLKKDVFGVAYVDPYILKSTLKQN